MINKCEDKREGVPGFISVSLNNSAIDSGIKLCKKHKHFATDSMDTVYLKTTLPNLVGQATLGDWIDLLRKNRNIQVEQMSKTILLRGTLYLLIYKLKNIFRALDPETKISNDLWKLIFDLTQKLGALHVFIDAWETTKENS